MPVLTNTQLLVTLMISVMFVAACLSIIIRLIAWGCEAKLAREAERQKRLLVELQAKQWGYGRGDREVVT